MATIGKVSAVFTASTSGLTSGVSRAASSLNKLQGSVNSLGGSMRTLVAIQGAQLFGSMAATAGQYVSSLVRMGQAQADVLDSQSKLAARTGMTMSEFQGLALAGDLAGVSYETIAKAATKADIAFVKAAGGSASARAAFDAIGLSIDELNGKSAAERFDAIAASIAALPTEAERAAAAVAIFGKAGAELLPMFAGGAEGIAQAREQAERLGIALTNAQGQDIEAMNDAFTMAGKAIEGVINQVVAYLAPAVQAVADQFTNLVGTIGGANIGQAIGDGILQGARFLAGIGDYIITNFSTVFSYLSEVGAQWGAVGDFINRTANFLSGVFNAARAGMGFVILGFGGVIEALASVAQRIGGFLGFDTSTLDAIVAGAGAVNESIKQGIAENMNAAAAGFSAAFDETSSSVGQAIGGPLTQMIDDAIAQADASRAAIDEASRTPIEVKATVDTAESRQAVKGIDSRSAEGVAEMFRALRGGVGDVQQRQLSVLEQIAENTSDDGSDLAVDF